MTREEAITVFKAFMENPLFSDVHKQAFNIAIHDIKQRHEWDINKLMLVPKTEWEQEPILDKIRAEIERHQKWLLHAGYTVYNVDIALDAIKAVVAESEEEE